MNNSRSYDNVPPLASNTVTIATTAPQVRIAPAGQIRQMSAVPMRQPVPIRKIITGTPENANFQQQNAAFLHQIKEEPVDMDYASTSSGPLIGPSGGPSSSSGNFQQYQRGSPVTSGALIGPAPSGSSQPTNQMDQPAPVNLASKVAEVFLTAGHAFQKLGDLTLQLHTTADAEESKWSEKEVDELKHALTRFAHELDQISTCVASRTTKHIKNDIKRRHMVSAPDDGGQQVKRMTMTSSGGGPSTSSSYLTGGPTGLMGHAVPMTQKRVGIQPMAKMMTTRPMMQTRYTVAPLPASSTSSTTPNHATSSSAVMTTSSMSSSSPSTSGQLQTSSGMPQLHSHIGSAPSTATQRTRVIHAAAVPPPQGLKMGGVIGQKPATRILSTPSSGALILEQHND